MYTMDYEPKPNNPKKRVRASQACVHCRKKKIKCDERKPDCLQCQETGVSCEYTTPKKRGPRKGYVQLLEERLAQMERKLLGPTGQYQATNEDHLPPINSPIQSYENTENSFDLPSLEIVNHLVDLFFQNINSIFPFVHRTILKKTIQDGTVSRPLLYSVLAIGARFSNDPAIRTNPPYLAGEQYAEKALSLVDADMLQPNLANIQFWGIMSCLEYGRASGSKSWIYGGLAIRFCQELGLYKEEVMSTPILSDDGSIDTITMSLRRRIFWSCFCIDRLVSAGTHRPQCIERSDCDTNPVSIADVITLRDPTYHRNAEGKKISDDSLLDIAKHYMRIIEIYGEVNRFMNRAKSNSASVVWPPIPEFRNLDTQLKSWKERLPETFQFNSANLEHHHHHASATYLNVWLSAHAIWCSSMMVLHRGSLAFSDIKPSDTIPEDLYRRIQSSIDTCRICVDSAMSLFSAIKDRCGYNTLPYMGYSAYVFATVLMTSTFSGTPESCQKSSRGLKVLYDLIDCMRPYWPMCERLANATKELLVTHQKLYQTTEYYSIRYPPRTDSYVSPGLRDPSAHSQPPSLSMLLSNSDTSSVPAYPSPYQNSDGFYMPLTDRNTSGLMSNWNGGNEIDFNSLEFLYDTDLFGQVVFDVAQTQPPLTEGDSTSSVYPKASLLSTTKPDIPTSTPTLSAFRSIIPTHPASYPSKSLWD
ncbi:fungal-specific transcription factor domain-containing protein [Choanephora cucurbitarum]|nr:fungal-specific transcription factor domain-containing protein [Choanephora cucurbitarum]